MLNSKIQPRTFQSHQDLLNIGSLIRRAYAKSPSCNAWSFCRFDIWAQRRIADSNAFFENDWQKYVHLWHNLNDDLVAATFLPDATHWSKNFTQRAIVLDPDHSNLLPEILDMQDLSQPCEIEALQTNTYLTTLLQERNYQPSSDYMVDREKILAGTPAEKDALPPGFQYRILKNSDWFSYFVAVNAVFNMMDNADSFRSIREAPSCVPELNINVVTQEGEIASFCSVWWDRDNNFAEFEPVGTVPRFQKKGLGSSLLAYACNQLRLMRCPRVAVASWSEAEGANKLYAMNGLLERDRIYSWKKAA